MPELTQCPECQRKLNVPDGYLGRTVECPACGKTFTAELFTPPRPAPTAPEPPRREAYEDRPPGRRDDRDYDDRPRLRRGRDYGNFDRGYADGRPHRGPTVKVLGIVTLCLFFFPLICWVLGIITLVMAFSDLAAMDRGAMDPSGRGETKTGQVCAIIGMIIPFFLIFTCCGLNIFFRGLR